MASNEARSALEQYMLACFAFLVEEKGFRFKRGEKNVWYTEAYYLATDIGISVMVDYLDSYIEVDLIKTQQGKLLPEWKKLSTTARWERLFLLAVENVLRVQDERMEQLRQLAGSPQPWEPSTYKAILNIYSELVKDHIDALRAYPSEILFPEPPAKR